MTRKIAIIVIVCIQIIAAALLISNFTLLQQLNSTSSADMEAVQDSPIISNIREIRLNLAEPIFSSVLPSLEKSLSTLMPVIQSLFTPLPSEATPATYPLDEPLIDLGRMLFYDWRLSINQTVSCNSCHPLDQYGVDGLVNSLGVAGVPVGRNAPTVYNAALHRAQFWDGRSHTVEEQAKGPLMAPAEMGMADATVVEAILRVIPEYEPYFAAAFPGEASPITMDNVAKAIGAFERRLITPSRFDQFLAGDRTQLNEQEQRGLATFVDVGCPTCHVGATVGGIYFKKLGEHEPYLTQDVGRFAVTGLEEDRHVFKVPSLRNVAKTAPYLHDGSVETLEEMVLLMARHQLGKELTSEQVSDIIAFLHSLTGELPTDYIAPPKLPGVDGP